MEIKILFDVLFIYLFTAILVASGNHDGTKSNVAIWKLLFRDYRKWTGFYQRYNRPYSCNLYVHSVKLDESGGTYLSFKARNATFDMLAWSDDNTVVSFKKTLTFNTSIDFPADESFETSGVFVRSGAIWTYRANITQPKNRGFQELELHAMSTSTPNISETKDRSFSLGLAVGIPVTLAVVLMCTGIGLGIWAIKKGYLRHIPSAYKNFRNPESTQVTFEQSEPNNVHM